MSLNRLTLVINASYEPINIVSVRRAITLVMSGKAIVEASSTDIIRSSAASFPAPSVVRLLVYRRMPRHTRAVSRKSIMLRDRQTCQYCGHRMEPKRLTLDHVTPRSRGGPSTWENLVACCYTCNNKKADRTPDEAGMYLLHRPAPVGIHARHRLMIGTEQPDWEKYLFC